MVGIAKYAATRMTMSIGVAVLVVMAPVVPASVSSSDVPPPDKTALIMGGTTGPTLKDADIETVRNQFIAPTHPGQNVDYVAVTAPQELWPVTGLIRLICLAVCDPSIFGPGGAAWPDEPWWKLSGLFDLTLDQSVQAGVTDLETAMAVHGNDHLVINGYSQGAAIANVEKRKLAEQYPDRTKAPDIDFVLGGDPNLPNGGLTARFPGLYLPIGWTFTGAEPTDTPFYTVVITRQYDFFADFPLYPLNLIADLNAVLGAFYVHGYPSGVSLVPDPSTSPPIQSQYGDTSYYFFETPDLPLFAPLRTLGVPESLIDVVEPFFRVLVELGYDRSIPAGEPTPARLIPTLDPGKVTADLFNAIGEGVNNALAVIGSPPLLSIPAPITLAAPANETAKADISPQVTPTETPTQTDQVTATGSQQMSTDMAPSTTKVTEAKANEASAGPTVVSTPEPSVSASVSEPPKPTGLPALPRRVVRDSLGVGEQPIRTAEADEGAATAGPSSVASSPTASTGRESSGGDSSGGGVDDS